MASVAEYLNPYLIHMPFYLCVVGSRDGGNQKGGGDGRGGGSRGRGDDRNIIKLWTKTKRRQIGRL